ncbi:unnamed protein product [Citrullus colocynthis]|uniref:Uncharacterized protein n=1 Tax=Citrullus colocynthis TaxID=252529 RepID=A0ABP0XK34_9ROSI
MVQMYVIKPEEIRIVLRCRPTDLSTAIPATALVRVTASSHLPLLFLTPSPNTSLCHFTGRCSVP